MRRFYASSEVRPSERPIQGLPRAPARKYFRAVSRRIEAAAIYNEGPPAGAQVILTYVGSLAIHVTSAQFSIRDLLIWTGLCALGTAFFVWLQLQTAMLANAVIMLLLAFTVWKTRPILRTFLLHCSFMLPMATLIGPELFNGTVNLPTGIVSLCLLVYFGATVFEIRRMVMARRSQ